jgi:hypothetical protein
MELTPGGSLSSEAATRSATMLATARQGKAGVALSGPKDDQHKRARLTVTLPLGQAKHESALDLLGVR